MEKKKISISTIVFFIVLVLLLIVLIPFYSSLGNILWLALQVELGLDTYICLFAFLFCIVAVILGFKFRIDFIKIFFLLLGFAFLTQPLWGYMQSKSYVDDYLSNYHFQKVSVILSSSCELEEQVQEKIINSLQEQYGSNLDFDVETPKRKNNSWKEKIRCMPTKTHYAYVIQYHDSTGAERKLAYESKESLAAGVLIHSYEVLYQVIGDYLKEKQPNRKVNYEFFYYDGTYHLKELDRTSVWKQKFSLPSPMEISLQNFSQDPRLVLKVTFGIGVKEEEAHRIIESLAQQSSKPIRVVVEYGTKTDYWYHDQWYSSEDEFFKQFE